MIALGLLLIFWMQRSCGGKYLIKTEAVHDTILINGDTQLFTVQDTILQPYKVYFRDSIPDVDTARIIKDYFAGRIYRDTIKARDVTAVIEDSISENKMEGHKVLIENSRDLHLSTYTPKTSDKIFMGGFAGYSPGNLHGQAGISLMLITKNDVFYQYQYDIISGMHSLGFGYKLQIKKHK